MNAQVTSVEGAALVLRAQHFVGLAPRPIDLLPLLRLGCLAQLWSCEAADASWTDQFTVDIFSLEEQLGLRARWRTADLDDLLPHVYELVNSRAPGSSATLLPYDLTNRWLAALPELHKQLVVPASLLTQPRAKLTDKIVMRRWLRRSR